MQHPVREMSTKLSLILLFGLVGFISFSMLYLELPTRLTLLLSIALVSATCLFLGHSAKQIESYIVAGIKKMRFCYCRANDHWLRYWRMDCGRNYS